MKNRTTARPILNINSRPIGPAWTWSITMQVSSSGYTNRCHVTAIRGQGDDELVGSAWAHVGLQHDVSKVIEELAVEAMMAACEPLLDGSPGTRFVVVSTHF